MELEDIKKLDLKNGELLEVRLPHDVDVHRTEPLYFGGIVEEEFSKGDMELPYVVFFEHKDKNHCLASIREIKPDWIGYIQKPTGERKFI